MQARITDPFLPDFSAPIRGFVSRDPNYDLYSEGNYALRLCIQEENATFCDLDLPNVGGNASPNLTPFDCTHERLPVVIIAGVTDQTVSPQRRREEEAPRTLRRDAGFIVGTSLRLRASAVKNWG